MLHHLITPNLFTDNESLRIGVNQCECTVLAVHRGIVQVQLVHNRLNLVIFAFRSILLLFAIAAQSLVGFLFLQLANGSIKYNCWCYYEYCGGFY